MTTSGKSTLFKRILKWVMASILLFIVYFVITLIHGTVTDFQPEEKIALQVGGGGNGEPVPAGDTLSIFNWNIGYAGLGAESDFFYDDNRFFFSGDKMVRPTEGLSRKNFQGILSTIKANQAQFYTLQEVDFDARRSYGTNQYQGIQQALPQTSGVYAVNFKSPRVPIPVCEPWDVIGRVDAGLATYSVFKPLDAVRYQYPGTFPWPERIFNLDRCMAVHRFQVGNGKQLLIINSHNSAYDKGGTMKKLEMDYMKRFLMDEYSKGNYIVVGADWNQCPPGFQFDALSPVKDDGYTQLNIPPDYLVGWGWAFDKSIPTNRKLTEAYTKGKTFTTLIDFYLLSPNVELVEVKAVDLDFAYSDHQPVKMKFVLK